MHDYVKPVFFLLALVLVTGAIGGVMAANRGRMVAVWSIICALFPPLLLVIYFLRPICEVEGKFKRCSHCNELIKWHETVCTYCRSAQPETRGSDT